MTNNEIMQYLKGLAGAKAIEYGGASGTQCVELPRAYADKIAGKALGALGNGKDVAQTLISNFPKLFKKVKATEIQAGDIISAYSTSAIQQGKNLYGHTGIVLSRSGGSYVFLEQWAGSNTIRANNRTIIDGGTKNTAILCVARPIQLDGGTPSVIADEPSTDRKDIHDIALEVIRGIWGNGKARTTTLTKAGYNPEEVQAEVNAIINGDKTNSAKTSTENATTPPPKPSEPTKTSTFKKGDRVQVKAGAKTYTGSGLAKFVYQTTYDVLQVGASGKPDYIVIGFAVGNAVTAAVNAKDLIKL
jgi:hypothetical protein